MTLKIYPVVLELVRRLAPFLPVLRARSASLGVTSTLDLKMSVPYFGDHARFVEVSTHEMVHQFTIQKLNQAWGVDDSASPIHLLPLWFVEGIAGWYSKGGIDTETELFLRDLVWNPDPDRHHEVLPFAEDRVQGARRRRAPRVSRAGEAPGRGRAHVTA